MSNLSRQNLLEKVKYHSSSKCGFCEKRTKFDQEDEEN